MMKKIRLDSFLVEQKLSLSREKAKKEIISGWVKVNGETFRDPSRRISGDEEISVERPGGIFVSRGGEKLAHALKDFKIDLTGIVGLDLGASTGGFTDCMLKAGAIKVYSVDVGYNQLDYSLRTDNRVVVLEKTHARDINKNLFKEKIDFFTADLSFISILKILPAVYNTFSSIKGIILIKPQFEAEQHQQKKGVVRKPEDHKEILLRTVKGILKTGFEVEGITYSPIKGPAGNIEFFLLINKADSSLNIINEYNQTGINKNSINNNYLNSIKSNLNIDQEIESYWHERISEIVEISHKKLN
jgi:23S rRNA (cytidine1920-2'-O)/16S rRNA (cytidine1409-2'-O)-methyltransferase